MTRKEETLAPHIEELRAVLIKCFTVIGIFFIPMFFLAPTCMDWLIKIILSDNKIPLNFFSPMEVFIIQLKTAFVLDVLICFPYIANKLWNFIISGLYDHERKFIQSVILSSYLLFIFGILFCLFIILPMVINFGLSYAGENLKATLGLANVITLALWLSPIFGIMFQFPLITYALICFNIVEYKTVISKRPYVFVGILILSALLTPPDIISQILLTLPTYLLFEAGLFVARYKNPKKYKD